MFQLRCLFKALKCLPVIPLYSISIVVYIADFICCTRCVDLFRAFCHYLIEVFQHRGVIFFITRHKSQSPISFHTPLVDDRLEQFFRLFPVLLYPITVPIQESQAELRIRIVPARLIIGPRHRIILFGITIPVTQNAHIEVRFHLAKLFRLLKVLVGALKISLRSV